MRMRTRSIDLAYASIMYSIDAARNRDEREYATESKSEEHLKAMARKQLDINCRLKEAKKGREFTAWAWQSVSDMEGEMTLKEYERAEAEEKRLDELRQCGLNIREIELISMHKRGVMPATLHPHAAHCHLEEIQRKICSRERRVEAVRDYGSGVCLVGRRTMEAENVDFRCPKDLKHLVQLKDRDIDSVVDKAVEQTLKEEREREGKRKAYSSKDYWREERREEDGTEKVIKKDEEEAFGKKEEGELAAKLRRIGDDDDDDDDDDDVCGPVQMIHCVSEEEILSNKMSVDEIRKIPR